MYAISTSTLASPHTLGTDMLKIVTFKLDEALLEALDRYARMKRMSRSEAIREAIKRLLEQEGVPIPRVTRREARSNKIEFEIII